MSSPCKKQKVVVQEGGGESSSPPLFSIRLLDAISFAAIAHINQRRKDEASSPYINHPLEVMHMLARCGVQQENVLMAAVLHDVVEDTSVTLDEVATKLLCRVVLYGLDHRSFRSLLYVNILL